MTPKERSSALDPLDPVSSQRSCRLGAFLSAHSTGLSPDRRVHRGLSVSQLSLPVPLLAFHSQLSARVFLGADAGSLGDLQFRRRQSNGVCDSSRRSAPVGTIRLTGALTATGDGPGILTAGGWKNGGVGCGAAGAGAAGAGRSSGIGCASINSPPDCSCGSNSLSFDFRKCRYSGLISASPALIA